MSITKVSARRLTVSILALASLTTSAWFNAAAAQEASPTRSTATYGDWQVRCNQFRVPSQKDKKDAKAPEKAETVKGCDMVNVIRIRTGARKDATGNTVPARTGVLAQIAIGKPVGSSFMKIIYRVPPGVLLREPISLRLGKDKEGLAKASDDNLLKASYFRCMTQGCLADAIVSDGQLAALNAAKAAQMTFVGNNGRTYQVGVSMNGLSQALEAITK